MLIDSYYLVNLRVTGPTNKKKYIQVGLDEEGEIQTPPKGTS